MRVLFVSNSFPRDLRVNVSGSFQRMRMFVDALKEIAEIDLLFYVPPDMNITPTITSESERMLSRHWKADFRLCLCPRSTPGKAQSRWRQYCAGTLSLFKQSGYADTSGPQQIQVLNDRLHSKPDVIFVHRMAAMCPVLLTEARLPPIFLDLDDIEHIAYLRSIHWQSTWRSQLINYARIPALCFGEYRAIRRAYRTFVCSELDRRYLTNRWGLAGVAKVPNAVKIPKPRPLAPYPTLLFIGSYWYPPNVHAADFLIERVWPHIHRSMPEARLFVAGTQPERIPSYNKRPPGVEFTGFVDDLEALYQQSRVVCCPVLAGGGTRIK